MNNIKILDESPDSRLIVTLPKLAATIFDKGDLVSLESSAAVPLDAVTEDATFAGLAWQAAGTWTTEVQVLIKCVAEVTVSSDTYDTGNPLLYVSGDNGTEYVFADATSGTTICWAMQTKTSAVTRLRVLFDAPSLEKLWAIT